MLTMPPTLRDLQSTNGTWIGDERIIETELNADTDITVGSTVIQFRMR
jgi:pSer/pThr/pTyr-binding forkhead associated (FHA) protein